jgi:hypothetical protein
MSFLGSFFGSDQKKDIQRAKVASDAALKTGLNEANTQYDNAMGFYTPYAQTGQAANTLYANATGVNGQPAAQTAANQFYSSDPFRQSNEDFANKQLAQTFNARGSLYGGNAMLAAARGSLERGSTDWNNWLNRISGQAAQGANVAGAQSGVAQGKGQLAYGAGTTQAGNEINFGNAMAAARSIPINNLLGVAGTAVKMFTPGWGGATPVGNAMSGIKGMFG